MSAWVVRVVQEFRLEAADANEANAFMVNASHRKIKGAVLVDGVACCAPAASAPDSAGKP